MTTPANPARKYPDRNAHLTREDRKIDRCRRCGSWRYAKVCTGACPTLLLVPS